MLLLVLIYMILTVGGLTLFKLGSDSLKIQISLQGIYFNINFLAIAGMICYIASFILWLIIIKNSKLTFIAPLTMGMVAILTLASGKFILGESIGVPHLAGAMLIIIGVLIINFFK